MITFISFLIFCQALGACIGAGTAVWAEVAFIRAMRDGKIDIAERAHLRFIAHGLRFGMTLLLLASLALVIAAYALGWALQPALTASYWILITFALLVIFISWALSRKHISFALGSAAVLSSWWLLAYLTLGQFPARSFGAAIALFVVLTAVIYAALYYIRLLALGSTMKHQHLAQKIDET